MNIQPGMVRLRRGQGFPKPLATLLVYGGQGVHEVCFILVASSLGFVEQLNLRDQIRNPVGADTSYRGYRAHDARRSIVPR